MNRSFKLCQNRLRLDPEMGILGVIEKQREKETKSIIHILYVPDTS